jgi:methylated-DNA-[protein]-cysteine S-methyltransferase
VIYDVLPTRFGDLLLVAGDEGLRAVVLPGRGGPPHGARRDRRALADAREQLAEYCAGERRTFTLRLDPRGTPFQREVWDAVAMIPYGETATYAGLAARLGRRAAARAVGAANGRNPLAIVIPCHRVVATNGALTGYAGGLAMKRALLDAERPGSAAHARGARSGTYA